MSNQIYTWETEYLFDFDDTRSCDILIGIIGGSRDRNQLYRYK